MQIKREALQIGDELRLVRDFYEPAAGEVGVGLSVEAPQHLTFNLDRTLFQKAAGNLVQNALAHTPSGGRVRIQAQNGTGQLVISVSDTGAGISEEHLPRVFDRFYRADPARTRNGALDLEAAEWSKLHCAPIGFPCTSHVRVMGFLVQCGILDD